jgi:hypothetical protein
MRSPLCKYQVLNQDRFKQSTFRVILPGKEVPVTVSKTLTLRLYSDSGNGFSFPDSPIQISFPTNSVRNRGNEN